MPPKVSSRPFEGPQTSVKLKISVNARGGKREEKGTFMANKFFQFQAQHIYVLLTISRGLLRKL